MKFWLNPQVIEMGDLKTKILANIAFELQSIHFQLKNLLEIINQANPTTMSEENHEK